MNRACNVVWTASAAEKLLWERWDGEHILYVPLSGQTHLLNEMGAETVKLLGKRPYDAPELAEKLASAFGIEADSRFVQIIEDTLAQLDEVGLAEPRFR